MSELFSTVMTITLVGMGVVFAFLSLMIFAMNITSGLIINIVNKYFPEEVKEEPKKAKKKTTSDDAEIAIAIALAHKAAGGR